ncbi:hypothetical protein PFZ49_12380 [Microbacterium lacticum]|uniref:hypothetical protein n=1 Tax=Microbacterium lacticum TaxID=33885 RepID=UPI003A8711E5
MQSYLAERTIAAIALSVDPPANNDPAQFEATVTKLIANSKRCQSLSGERIWAALAEYTEGAAFGIGRHWRSHRSILDAVEAHLLPIVTDLRRRVNLSHEGPPWLLGDPPPRPVSESLRLNAANLRLKGTWWVCPEGVPITIDDDAVASGLHVVRDDYQTLGRLTRACVDGGARVYQIIGGEDWRRLCSAYGVSAPLETYDWGMPSSDNPTVPDWERVAQDFDAVHLSIGGYIRTAYRPIALNGGAWTVLAGWHPGSTAWLKERVFPISVCDDPK